VSQEAIASDRNNIYFLSDDYTIYAFNGTGDDIPISQRVETELSSISSFNRVRLELINNQLRVYYAKGSSTVMDHSLIYDIEQDKWFRDTGRPVLGCVQRYLDDLELVEISAKTGQLFLAEVGTSDLGKPIAFNWWSSYKPYGSGMGKDKVSKFRVFVLPSDTVYNLLVGKDVDWRNDVT